MALSAPRVATEVHKAFKMLQLTFRSDALKTAFLLTVEQRAQDTMAAPISMFVPATLIVVLSAPLALKLVPPNRFYGVRTAETLADSQVWFRTNRVAGFLLMLAATFAIIAYRLNPELASGESYLGVLILILPVLSALVFTGMYTRSLSKRSK